MNDPPPTLQWMVAPPFFSRSLNLFRIGLVKLSFILILNLVHIDLVDFDSLLFNDRQVRNKALQSLQLSLDYV